MRKTYILDTNVLLQSPHALTSFEDNDIVICASVIEELDKYKNATGEVGANARSVIRQLDEYRSLGNMSDGVVLNTGGSIRLVIETPGVKNNPWDETKNDNKILAICKYLTNTGEPAIIVTNDIILRIKADAVGLKAEEFSTDRASKSSLAYTGRLNVWVPEEKLREFVKTAKLSQSDVYLCNENGIKTFPKLVMNQFLVLTSDMNPKSTVLGKFNGTDIVPLYYKNERPCDISPRNLGQFFLQEALMDDSVPLVIARGAAGTAKTFYSLAVGLQKTMNETPKLYRKILVCRPNAEFDDDIGFLPGSEQDKIGPLLRPIRDNLEVLVDKNEESRYKSETALTEKVDALFQREIITAQALNYIRGRSIVKTWLIIDEAQNLSPKQAKGIITRAGEGTKIILVGDPDQIDNPMLDKQNNGLSYAADKMKGSRLCYQITMEDEECERSALALDAAGRM